MVEQVLQRERGATEMTKREMDGAPAQWLFGQGGTRAFRFVLQLDCCARKSRRLVRRAFSSCEAPALLQLLAASVIAVAEIRLYLGCIP
jgi:hypothetical protein